MHTEAPYALRWCEVQRLRTGPGAEPTSRQAGYAAGVSEGCTAPDSACSAISKAKPEAMSAAKMATVSGRTVPRQTMPSPKAFTSAFRPGKSCSRPSVRSC